MTKRTRLFIPLIFAVLLTGCMSRVTIIVTATPSPSSPSSPLTPGSLAPTDVPPERPASGPTGAPSAAPTVPTVPTQAATATPAPVSAAVRIWVAPNVPPELQEDLTPLVQSGNYAWGKESDSPVKLVITPTGNSNGLAAQWIYVPVVPFPTIADNIQWADIQRYWKGDTSAVAAVIGSNQPPVFVASQPTIDWLTGLLGAPAPGLTIQMVPADGVTTSLWVRRPNAWSLVPFHQLDPALKALTLDGANLFNRALDTGKYPLVENFSFTGDAALAARAADAAKAAGKWSATNRDLSKLTVVVMTGTTALVRATAWQMEQSGITLPARDIKPFLADADFVHTSNEVAFDKDCPYPDPTYQASNLRFCSRDSYLDLLKEIKLNVVELTGNHVIDWSRDSFSHTLDLYDANHIGYFGGGRNEEDARKALIVKSNGNTLAFIGCNPVGPAPAWAKPDRVGAAACDDEFLSKEIPRLKTVANVVVMTIQYQEYYQYSPTLDQVAFFKKYADMGADLVMGSQAHQPQGFAFTDKTFIHYGIGNLFFDQMDDIATRQMFADKLIIYEGRHLSTILFTGLSEDYSRPRPMTADERTAFLRTIFGASGW